MSDEAPSEPTGSWRTPLRDDLPPDVYAAFSYLHRLIDEDRRPHREIARSLNVSPATFTKRFRLTEKNFPSLDRVLALFTALGREPAEFLARWGHRWEEPWSEAGLIYRGPLPAARPSGSDAGRVAPAGLVPTVAVVAGADTVGTTAAEPIPIPAARAWRTRRSLLTGVIVAVAVLVGGIGGVLAYRNSTDSYRYDDTDPLVSDCTSATRESVFFSHLYHDWPAQKLPPTEQLIEMHFSPICRTVWAVLKSGIPGRTMATLHRESDGRELTCVADMDGNCATHQLNDADVKSHAFATSDDAYGKTPSH